MSPAENKYDHIFKIAQEYGIKIVFICATREDPDGDQPNNKLDEAVDAEEGEDDWLWAVDEDEE